MASPVKTFILDAAQHLVEPPDFWSLRLKGALRSKAPQVVPSPEGGHAWSFDGGAWLRPLGLEVAADASARDLKAQGYAYAQLRKGAFSPKERLRDMDADGIRAACLFPTYGLWLRRLADRDLLLACVRAYNDGALEWAREGDAARLLPSALVPAVGIEEAVTEARRALRAGYRGLVFTGWPAGAGQPQDEESRFWALCEEASAVINLVGGGPNLAMSVDASAPMEAAWVSNATPKGTNLAWFVLTGILDRFPSLKLALIEAGAGWLPFYLEQLDDMYRRGRWWAHASLRYKPSEYIQRQVKVTLQGDSFAVLARAEIGVGALMWASGYPGSMTTWPHSQLAIEEELRGLPESERAALLAGNCAALYGVKLP